MKLSAKFFSIIELMTVVLVICLLMSLIVPTFINLKTSTKSVLCKSQLRQLGVLIGSYASNNSGYLPNDLSTDIPKLTSSKYNNEFYKNWNGHLLPYIDNGLANYHRAAKLRKDGEIYTYDYINGTNPGVGTIKPKETTDGGWVVIHDACYKGGYNDLKTFICPEIATSTFDVGVSNACNGLRVPRISEMTHFLGFMEMKWDYLGGGVPTTYLANDICFGFDGPYMAPQQSLRLDQINNISQKALLIEGGLAWSGGTNGEPSILYYRIKNTDFGVQYLTVDTPSASKTGFHKVNYVHDTNRDPFWVMKLGYYNYFPFNDANKGNAAELADKFNNCFKGKAEMMINSIYSYYGPNYTIISYVDPTSKPFDNFFKTYAPGVTLLPFEFFESDFHYLNGNMNVLFGDNSVATKSQAWLTQNRELIGSISN